jgi:hypothetical protein
VAQMHTPASIALELGRFEMQLDPTRKTMHYDKSEMSVERFTSLGFGEAAHIYVTVGSYLPGLKPETLSKIGEKVAGGWRVEAPRKGNASLWRRLLESDMSIVLVPPENPAWVEKCIRSLHEPIIHTNENMSLSSKAYALCRKLLKSEASLVLVAFGLYRDTFSFFGKGEAFIRACEVMSQRPQALWDLTDEQKRTLTKGAFRLLPAAARST